MANFAEKLAVLMKNQALSANALAKKSGVSQTAISGYLRGSSNPSWPHVQILAIALGVDVSDLKDDSPIVGKKKKK